LIYKDSFPRPEDPPADEQRHYRNDEKKEQPRDEPTDILINKECDCYRNCEQNEC
jgi:hypothetical protein